jgi:hypothetical protein
MASPNDSTPKTPLTWIVGSSVLTLLSLIFLAHFAAGSFEPALDLEEWHTHIEEPPGTPVEVLGPATFGLKCTSRLLFLDAPSDGRCALACHFAQACSGATANFMMASGTFPVVHLADGSYKASYEATGGNYGSLRFGVRTGPSRPERTLIAVWGATLAILFSAVVLTAVRLRIRRRTTRQERTGNSPYRTPQAPTDQGAEAPADVATDEDSQRWLLLVVACFLLAFGSVVFPLYAALR